jgi:arsenate reductase (glutaredoxin)
MITIYHNPAYGTSRNTLDLIRNSGAEPTIIEYLETPSSRATLVELIAAMRIAASDLLRGWGTPYNELRLDDPKWSEDELIDFTLEQPILINRPIVVTPLGTALSAERRRQSSISCHRHREASLEKNMANSLLTRRADVLQPLADVCEFNSVECA